MFFHRVFLMLNALAELLALNHHVRLCGIENTMFCMENPMIGAIAGRRQFRVRLFPTWRGMRVVRVANRGALARTQDRGCGAATKQTWFVDSRLGATAAVFIDQNGLGHQNLYAPLPLQGGEYP